LLPLFFKGYVLSKEATKRFVEGLEDSSKCRTDPGGAEDVEMGTLANTSHIYQIVDCNTKLLNCFITICILFK